TTWRSPYRCTQTIEQDVEQGPFRPLTAGIQWVASRFGHAPNDTGIPWSGHLQSRVSPIKLPEIRTLRGAYLGVGGKYLSIRQATGQNWPAANSVITSKLPKTRAIARSEVTAYQNERERRAANAAEFARINRLTVGRVP